MTIYHDEIVVQMSNYISIATVSECLRLRLESNIQARFNDAEVTTERPDGKGNDNAKPRVNIFLYQISPNMSFRNSDLPTRDQNGDLSNRPQAAVNLHYLFTFFGEEKKLIPQQLLGSTLIMLHSQPVLTRQMIRNVKRKSIAGEAKEFLAGTDLDTQVELMKFSPINMNLEELSKLWSVFFQTAYSLSTAFIGSVVLLESEENPKQSLPVRERNLYANIFREPIINSVHSILGLNNPIFVGDSIVIEGDQLLGKNTEVNIGGKEAEIVKIRNDQITAIIPADLSAGVQGTRIIHSETNGSIGKNLMSAESNVTPIFIIPKIVDWDVNNLIVEDTFIKSGEIELELNLIVKAEQRVTLILNEFQTSTEEAARGFKIESEIHPQDSDKATFNIKDVLIGTYLVRVSVDGAESVLKVDDDTESDTFNQYIDPLIELSNGA